MMRHYRDRREMEEWWTPCHAIPMFEYTHGDGKQLVQSVVKQEELKLLHTEDEAQKAIAEGSSVGDLPGPVRKALLGMPHANKRGGQKKWWDFYDQESLEMTYDMYKKDFQVFGYSPKLEQRPDLASPASSVTDDVGDLETFRRDSKVGIASLHSVSLSSVNINFGSGATWHASRMGSPQHRQQRVDSGAIQFGDTPASFS
eukprot:scaffold322195_cov39-Prasinocladus_malaysianus.AAC.1